MIERINAFVVQTRKEIDRQGQEIQHSASEISRLSSTVGVLKAKLMPRSPDHTSPAVPASDDIRLDAALQVENATNTAGSIALFCMNGVNGCSISVCNDVNSIVNQPTNSCKSSSLVFSLWAGFGRNQSPVS
jgi:hypothetical protein